MTSRAADVTVLTPSAARGTFENKQMYLELMEVDEGAPKSQVTMEADGVTIEKVFKVKTKKSTIYKRQKLKLSKFSTTILMPICGNSVFLLQVFLTKIPSYSVSYSGENGNKYHIPCFEMKRLSSISISVSQIEKFHFRNVKVASSRLYNKTEKNENPKVV